VKTAKSKLFDILEGVFSQRTVLVRAVARLIIGGGGGGGGGGGVYIHIFVFYPTDFLFYGM
jgi:hypothetical protein